MAETNFSGPVNAEAGFAVGGVVNESLIIAETNGTSAVSVFGTAGLEVDVEITGVYLVSLDTSAGNITVENPASTVVCTIAKGTVAGVLVGGTTLANTTVTAGTNLVVDSSTAGNARVYITYKPV
jgi:hypothetical protein